MHVTRTVVFVVKLTRLKEVGEVGVIQDYTRRKKGFRSSGVLNTLKGYWDFFFFWLNEYRRECDTKVLIRGVI